MALDDVSERLERITNCLDDAGVPYALVGGQAVALWVATVEPAAVRTTKDVDLLIDRADLPAARIAARSVQMDYFETLGVGMFIDRRDPNPRHGVHLVWAGEYVRPHEPVPAPTLNDRQTLPGGRHVVSLAKLVEMKLTAFRDQDRVHLRDMIDVGLIDDSIAQVLPADAATTSRRTAALNVPSEARRIASSHDLAPLVPKLMALAVRPRPPKGGTTNDEILDGVAHWGGASLCKPIASPKRRTSQSAVPNNLARCRSRCSESSGRRGCRRSGFRRSRCRGRISCRGRGGSTRDA